VNEPPAARRLTFRRLVGLDRSGPPPPETTAGQPLRPWTLPNAVGYLRLAGIPVFLLVAFSDDNGHSVTAGLLYAAVAWGDYLDGIVARVTGQYSRLGALLDPLVDRLLVLAGMAVCWHFELLPRWALAALAAREILMIPVVSYGLKLGLDLKINWFGRAGVFPAMSAAPLAMFGAGGLAKWCLYLGLALVILASVVYVRDGFRQLRKRP
jgi:cardiolipin synthase